MNKPNFLKQKIFNIYRNSQIKHHELRYLFWECTLKCNLNCLHCGSDCIKTSGVPDMPLSDFIQVLDDIKNKNTFKNLTVCITGGEPLLRSDLEKAGLEIIKRGFNWGIVTNGMLLTRERFNSLIHAGMGSLSFSLDGFEEEHTWLRINPLSYKNVCSGIQMAVEFQKKFPGRLVFDVITCVHKKNLEILRDLRSDLIEKGVTQWRIFTIFPSGRASQNDLSLSKDQYLQLMDFISETRHFKDSKGRSIHLNYSCEGYLGKYELKVRDYFFFCRGGINVGSVMCDGSMSACLSVRGKGFIQGNIYDGSPDPAHKTVCTSFMDVWNSRYQCMRNRKWAKTGKCAHCSKWNNCLGNGLHLHSDLGQETSLCNYELLNR